MTIAFGICGCCLSEEAELEKRSGAEGEWIERLVAGLVRGLPDRRMGISARAEEREWQT